MQNDTAQLGANEPAKGELLTTAEVAALTGLTRNTLESYRSLRRQGMDRGPEFVTRGRAVLYPRVAVDAYLAAKREG
ncbi:MAG: helix-turn-helix domain-containing protein [Pseudomonadota bacterium]